MKQNRYIRQTLLDAIGENGQTKLLQAHVVVVGCGGLGSIAAPYLAGAGIGKLTLVDGDIPHISNLHRQVFFDSRPTELSKSEALGKHIRDLNPEIEVHIVSKMISKDSIDEYMKSADVVLECTDNIHVKYLVNDYCAKEGIPMVYGAIHKYDGYVSFFDNEGAASIHLRDIFPEPNVDIPSCSEVGVMGTLAGVIGLMQANEAIKYISGAGKCLTGKLLTYNILDNEQLKLKLKKNYTHDINAVFQSNSYIKESVCASYEINFSDLMKNRSDYELISILEDYEHQDIDDHVKRMPLNEFDLHEWKAISDKVHVFYCQSGARSGALTNAILSQYPNSNVLSLAEGLNGLK